jgi:uncharacterized protein (TIGR03435 family)
MTGGARARWYAERIRREGDVTPSVIRISGAGAVALLFVFAPTANGQTQPALTFEVASVKVADGMNGVMGGCRGVDSIYTPKQQESAPPLGRCVITNARLSHLIGIAFGVTMQQLSTGADWIQRGDLRFDVQAKAENPAKTTQQQLLTMLQNLLVERFHLKFHYEKAETSGFVLTVAKGGLKMQISKAEDEWDRFEGPQGEDIGKPVPGRPNTMKARKYTIPMLLRMITAVSTVGPGVDKTGLTGEYDFTLSWDDEGGPFMATALRQQLGLEMKPEKVTVSTFVVDSAEKPAAN